MIRITQIKLDFRHSEKQLINLLAKILKVSSSQIKEYNIFRRSIDARRSSAIFFIYTVDVLVENETQLLKKHQNNNRISLTPDCTYRHVSVPSDKSHLQPVIIGTGPAGLFAGLILAQLNLRPILIERGKPVENRLKDVYAFWKTGQLQSESNVQFGEGGAGTFSDGKLTTQIKDKNNRCRKVLTEFVKAGAPQEILSQSKPHIGTDILVGVVRSIRNTIISHGGQFKFNTKLEQLNINGDKLVSAKLSTGEEIPAEHLVLAIGHSARDTFQMLNDTGVKIIPKPFSIGVRIEHPQEMIDKQQFGAFAGDPRLPKADYKLVHHCANGRSVYTFCMCPGGEVIASSSELETVVTNGMSRYSRNKPNANSALLVNVNTEDFPSDHPLAGIEFQRIWERKAFRLAGSNYNAPAQTVGDFLDGIPTRDFGHIKPSYTPAVTPTDIALCLPDYVTSSLREAIVHLDKKLSGFADPAAVLTAIESRSSSPVRILRDENCRSISIKGVYPAGEGAGYAGGIVSAAVDGIKVAESIAANLSKKM